MSMRRLDSLCSYGASMRRSSQGSISASLVVVYPAGADVVPKDIRVKIKASFPTIAVNVHGVFAFSWKRQYAALRFFFLLGCVLKAI